MMSEAAGLAQWATDDRQKRKAGDQRDGTIAVCLSSGQVCDREKDGLRTGATTLHGGSTRDMCVCLCVTHTLTQSSAGQGARSIFYSRSRRSG